MTLTGANQRTVLEQAELKLASAHAANVARSNGSAFGCETCASLSGAEVEALLGELQSLRNRIVAHLRGSGLVPQFDPSQRGNILGPPNGGSHDAFYKAQ